MVNIKTIKALLDEVLIAEPIPFENVNLDREDSINFMLNSVWEQYQTQWKLVDRDKTEELMLAILVKTVAENFYLHTKLLMLGEGDTRPQSS